MQIQHDRVSHRKGLEAVGSGQGDLDALPILRQPRGANLTMELPHDRPRVGKEGPVELQADIAPARGQSVWSRRGPVEHQPGEAVVLGGADRDLVRCARRTEEERHCHYRHGEAGMPPGHEPSSVGWMTRSTRRASSSRRCSGMSGSR